MTKACITVDDPLVTKAFITVDDPLVTSTAKLKSPAVWACLGVYPLDMPRTPYRVSEGKLSQ